MATGIADVRDEVVEVCDGRLRLHVKVAGDGPPVVFFHPLPGLEWQPFLDRLAEHHTVYAPEHPGTSPGDPQAIREVHTLWELLLAYEEALRALGLERPAAVGMSYGGMVAADLAASFPDAFSRLVLLSRSGCGATTLRSGSWRWSRARRRSCRATCSSTPRARRRRR